MNKNDILVVEIVDTSNEGYGVARVDGLVVFVKDALKGDICKIKILKVTSKMCFAKIEEIVTPSNNRRPSDCEVSSKCGGCVFRYVNYEEQLNIKQSYVKNCLKRIGKFDNPSISPIIPAKNINYYRNKAQMPIRKDNNDELVVGFFSSGSHRVIDCENCKLHPNEFNEVVSIIKDWINTYHISIYNEKSHTGLVRHVYFRKSFSTGKLMVCIVVNGNDLVHKSQLMNELLSKTDYIDSIIVNINKGKTNVILGSKFMTVYGNDYIEERLCGLTFRLSPDSFFQVNTEQAEILYHVAHDFANLSNTDTVLDLYCGTGTIGLTMANDANNVIGVDIVKSAIDNANTNAKINNIENSKFICLTASDATSSLTEENITADVVILDPPRKGSDEITLENIVKISPKKIVYISCNPSTLARDLKFLCEKGYSLRKVQPVDMFPYTSHVESVVLLTKIQKQYEK